jgi:lipopolysaccharide transport system ATP-binding protein
VAAHLEPDILIVDEVLAVGDFAFQQKCLGKMGAVASGGHTVLFVSHNMAAIESLCDRGIVLEEGSVAFCGAQIEAVARYHQSFAGTLGQGRFVPNAAGERRDALRAQIVGATVTDSRSGEIGQVRAGGRAEFRVDCFANETLDRPGLGIGIDSSSGQRIVTLHTNHDPSLCRHGKVSGAFSFFCAVELPLVPGSYTTKLSLENADQTVDGLEQAMSFTVLPADYYGSGGRIGRGVVLCRQEWMLDERDSLALPSMGRDSGQS